MKLNARQRLLVLGGLLLAVLAVGTWLGDKTTPSETEVVAPSKSTSRTATSGGAPEGASSETLLVNLETLKSRDLGSVSRDPFATGAPPVSKSGRRKPGMPAAHASSVAQLPPSAPALPFTYMGKLISGKEITVFLTLGDRNLVVHEGDTIDALYRVEHIADSAITLVYLPLDQRQTIVMGEPPDHPDASVPERLSGQEGSFRGSGRQTAPPPPDPTAFAIPQQSPASVQAPAPPGQDAPSAGLGQSQPSAGAGQSQTFSGPVPPQYVPKEGVPVQLRP